MLAAGAGAAVSLGHRSGAHSALGGSAPRSSPVGNGGTGHSRTGHSGAGRGTGSLAVSLIAARAIAARVDPGIVDIVSTLMDNSEDQIFGTGMVISSSGLVLTNEHVVDGSTSVSATLVSSGRPYSARVVGYDSAADVALLQLVGASGLKPVTLSDSSEATYGEAVFAFGDAGGPGSPPSTAYGTIIALDQSVSVGDNNGHFKEMYGMIQTDVPLQPGDSGGPLVNGTDAVIGMDTAGNTPGPGSAATSLAIPINAALSIASQIRSGKASSTVHVGLAGYLGFTVVDASSRHPCASGSYGLGFAVSSPVSSGALICEADPYTPAGQGFVWTGDVIVSVNGQAIGSAADLIAMTAAARPGDTFTIDYVDQVGATEAVSVTLAGWVKPLFGEPVA